MALTSLPMPRTMPIEIIEREDWDRHGNPYEDWAGTKLGNTRTCDAQGFFFTFGITAMYSYNAMLCLYYACAIACHMKEKHIIKYVEPFLHAFPLLLGLSLSAASLFLKLFNPSAFESWCTLKPLGCEITNQYPSEECVRGKRIAFVVTEYYLQGALILLAVIVVISLLMVLVTVIKTDRMGIVRSIKKGEIHPQQEIIDGNQNGETHLSRVSRTFNKRITEHHTNTKIVLVQAVTYIIAFMLTLTFPFIQVLMPASAVPAEAIYNLELIFLPLQGFFNFCIFLGHKIFLYRRIDRSAPICKILDSMLTNNLDEPIILSRISIISFDEKRAKLELEMDDEMMHEHHIYNVSEEGEVQATSVVYDPVNDEGISYPSNESTSTGADCAMFASSWASPRNGISFDGKSIEGLSQLSSIEMSSTLSKKSVGTNGLLSYGENQGDTLSSGDLSLSQSNGGLT